MNGELERLRRTEIWIAWVRVFAVPFAAFEVAVVGNEHPPGYERLGWATAVALSVGAIGFFWLAHRDLDRTGRARIGFLAGDVNQGRTVTVSDLVLVNRQQLVPLTAANYLMDVNVSGSVTVSDKVIVNRNLLHALPTP